MSDTRVPAITLPQNQETPASREIAPGPIAFTYVYARSRDTRAANAPGQDFIAFRYDAQRIAFAVCDGVSQSFYGEIAARLLGSRLVEFLWTDALDDHLLDSLNGALHHWTAEATTAVQTHVINPKLPEMQRVALERKRENGSESMFVAGVIDREQHQLALCWMGDMRLWLWDAEHRAIDIPGAEWQTRERWSSRLGPKNGSARGCVMPLGAVTRITAHSDGVGHYANEFAELSQDQLNSMVDDLLQGAGSDDISVLDIDLAFKPRYGDLDTLPTPTLHLIDPREPVLTWEAVPLAGRYRVLVDDGNLPFTRDIPDTSGTTFFPPFDSKLDSQTLTCAVQALNDYTFPSAWSAPMTLRMGATVEVLPTPQMVSPLPSAHDTQPSALAVKLDQSKRKKSRTASLLTIVLSATLLALLIVAVWIVVVIIGWNDLVQLVPNR